MPTGKNKDVPIRSALRAYARWFIDDKRAATAIEYGLIVACLFLVIIASVTLVGDDVSESFNLVANQMDAASN